METDALLQGSKPQNSTNLRNELRKEEDSMGSERGGRLGFLLMLFSSLCYALVTSFAHFAETKYSYPVANLLLIRCFTSITLSSLYVYFNRDNVNIHLPAKSVLMLTARGLLGGCSAALSFAALARLPVGTATTIFYASPALTTLLSAIFLRDPLSYALLLTILINFVGIALVSQPTMSGTHWGGVAFALGMAICSSSVFVVQRGMGSRVHFVLGVFAYGCGCALMSCFTANRESLSIMLEDKAGSAFALCSGLAGFGSQSFLNRGLQLVPAGPAIVVRSFSVPLTYVMGLVMLGEFPSVIDTIGVIIVVASVVTIGYQKLLLKQVGGTSAE